VRRDACTVYVLSVSVVCVYCPPSLSIVFVVFVCVMSVLCACCLLSVYTCAQAHRGRPGEETAVHDHLRDFHGPHHTWEQGGAAQLPRLAGCPRLLRGQRRGRDGEGGQEHVPQQQASHLARIVSSSPVDPRERLQDPYPWEELHARHSGQEVRCPDTYLPYE
jgi:hypothetical protein